MKKRAPKDLSEGGKHLWDEIVGGSGDLDIIQLTLLEEACRCQDRLDDLDEAIRTIGPMTTGSQGQEVVNPALTEARGQQTTQYRLLATIRQMMPDLGRSKKPQGAARGAYNTTPSIPASVSSLDRARAAKAANE